MILKNIKVEYQNKMKKEITKRKITKEIGRLVFYDVQLDDAGRFILPKILKKYIKHKNDYKFDENDPLIALVDIGGHGSAFIGRSSGNYLVLGPDPDIIEMNRPDVSPHIGYPRSGAEIDQFRRFKISKEHLAYIGAINLKGSVQEGLVICFDEGNCMLEIFTEYNWKIFKRYSKDILNLIRSNLDKSLRNEFEMYIYSLKPLIYRIGRA